jgi:hypothetical protein
MNIMRIFCKTFFNVLCIEGLANLHANTRHETATGPVDELASSYLLPMFLNCSLLTFLVTCDHLSYSKF